MRSAARTTYFIQAENGFIKIGATTISVSGRLKALQVGCPLKLTLLGTLRSQDWPENKLHHRFAKERRGGEWFYPSIELLEFMKNQDIDVPTHEFWFSNPALELLRSIESNRLPQAEKLKDLNHKQRETLASQIKCNSEHLYKIAMGFRPCPARLAEKIEKATNGLLKKEDLVWPNKEH